MKTLGRYGTFVLILPVVCAAALIGPSIGIAQSPTANQADPLTRHLNDVINQGSAVILGMHGSTCNQAGSNGCYFKLRWNSAKANIVPLASGAQNLNGSNPASGSYVGRWFIDDPAVCKGSRGEAEGLLVYSSTEVWGYENSCRITKSVSHGSKTHLTMRCSGEGMPSTGPEQESVEVVEGKLERTLRVDKKPRTFTYSRCP
jgi:hypothetical protein